MRTRYRGPPSGTYIVIRDGFSDLGGGYMELRNTHVAPLSMLLGNYGPHYTAMAFAFRELSFFLCDNSDDCVINAVVHRTPDETDRHIAGKIVWVIGPLTEEQVLEFHLYGLENPEKVPPKELQLLTMVPSSYNDEDDCREDDLLQDPLLDGLGKGEYEAYLDEEGVAQLRPLAHVSSPSQDTNQYRLLSVLMLQCHAKYPPKENYKLSFMLLPSQGRCDTDGVNLFSNKEFFDAVNKSARDKLETMQNNETILPGDEVEKRYIFEQLWAFIHSEIGKCDAYEDKSSYFSFKKTVTEMMIMNNMVDGTIMEVYRIEGESEAIYHKSAKHEWDCIGLYDFDEKTKPRFGPRFWKPFDNRSCYLQYEEQTTSIQ